VAHAAEQIPESPPRAVTDSRENEGCHGTFDLTESRLTVGVGTRERYIKMFANLKQTLVVRIGEMPQDTVEHLLSRLPTFGGRKGIGGMRFEGHGREGNRNTKTSPWRGEDEWSQTRLARALCTRHPPRNRRSHRGALFGHTGRHAGGSVGLPEAKVNLEHSEHTVRYSATREAVGETKEGDPSPVSGRDQSHEPLL
jgi:hypothetical protein